MYMSLTNTLWKTFHVFGFLGEREVSSKQRESDSEDEQPKQKIFSPHPTSQRVPIFPGLSPAALIVSD